MSISIVLYCYKNKEYLEQTIVTLLNQTIVDWEAIVINDGFSYFPEASIPSDRLHQFRIINLKQSVGMVRSYLMGFALVRKKACVFLRGYDFQATSRLFDQQKLLVNKPIDFVFNVPRFFTEQGVQVEKDFEKLHKRLFTTGSVVAEFLKEKVSLKSSFCLSSFMFKTASLRFERINELLEKEIKPKRLQNEFVLLNLLCQRESFLGLCDSKQLVTINCKEDVNTYEEDDSLEWCENI